MANHDTYSYQERLNLLFESGIIDFLRERAAKNGHVNIVEIGGGYGGLAHGIAQILKGRLNYYICDLPESLLFAALYLNLNLPNSTQTIYDGSQLWLTPVPRMGVSSMSPITCSMASWILALRLILQSIPCRSSKCPSRRSAII